MSTDTQTDTAPSSAETQNERPRRIEAPSALALLREALTHPGRLCEAFTAFHHYSFHNQLLAIVQCAERGLPIGPISSFNGWKAVGRHVRKGERAIGLWMPVLVRDRAKSASPATTGAAPDTAADGRTDDAASDERGAKRRRFVFRFNWFVLSQTEGQDYTMPDLPEWNREQALARLGITVEPFSYHDGNALGYARGRTIAVSPLAPTQLATLWHELAHVVLGHTEDVARSDSANLANDLCEFQAEAVAYLCLTALGLPGGESCRAYMQNWWSPDRGLPEAAASACIDAANRILAAGYPPKAAGTTVAGDAEPAHQLAA